MKIKSQNGQKEKFPWAFFIGIFVYGASLTLTRQLHVYHLLIIFFVFFCYTLHAKTRYLLFLLIPFLIKNIFYDGLRWIPFSFLKPIHVVEPYYVDLALFGIRQHGMLITLTDYISQHRHIFLDLYTGLFYILIDAFPIAVVLYLWKKRGAIHAWRYTLSLFLMNFLAQITYIFYPVAPPWFVQDHGLAVPEAPVPGSSAGLVHFEHIFGIDLFSKSYELNPFVFGAIPSMHVGYAVLISFFLTKTLPRQQLWIPALYICSVSYAALYLRHHYMIDIVIGALYAAAAYYMVEKILREVSHRCFSLLEPYFQPQSCITASQSLQYIFRWSKRKPVKEISC